MWGKLAEGDGLPRGFWRSYLLVAGTAFVASLMNPSGFGLWITSFGYIGNRFLVSVTEEYQSSNFHFVDFWPFLIMIGILVIVLGLSNKKVRSELLITSGAWLLMALYSARNFPLFVIVAAPLLALVLDSLVIEGAIRFKLFNRFKQLELRMKLMDDQLKGMFWPVNSVVIAATVLSLGYHFDVQGLGYDFVPGVFPVEAVNWLEENPQKGEMFNYFIWGGYLLYRQWPDMRVFIDGQTDFYGEALTPQYVQVINAEEGWETVLDEYAVDWAILPLDMRAAIAIQRDLGWEATYEDSTTVILRRD